MSVSNSGSDESLGLDTQDRVRSLSWAYKATDHMPSTSAGIPSYGSKDEQKMMEMYTELLDDNIRLWECVNQVRCQKYTADDALRKIYSMNKDEFYRKHPAYRNLLPGGHGSLSSQEPGGGSKDRMRKAEHITEHNSGLLRENARLKQCLRLLSQNERSPVDEVISSVFRLDDDSFVRRYPSAERNDILRSSLKKLRDNERRRFRTSSLPVHWVNFPFGRRHPCSEHAGPSRTNNNVSSVSKSRRSSCSPHRAYASPTDRKDYSLDERFRRSSWVKEEEDRTNHRLRDEDYRVSRSTDDYHGSPLRTSTLRRSYLDEADLHDRYGHIISSPSRVPEVQFAERRARLSDDFQRSPERRSYDRDGASGRSPLKDRHSTGRTWVPYMVSQHPYNWATSNNSSSPNTFGSHKDHNLHKYDFQSEDNEESGVMYRKTPNAPRPGRRTRSSHRPDLVLENSEASKPSGPTISFSRSPASSGKFSATKPKQTPRKEKCSVTHCSRSTIPRRLSLPMKGISGRRSSLSERKPLSARSPGNCVASFTCHSQKLSGNRCENPRRSLQCSRIGPEMGNISRNVRFDDRRKACYHASAERATDTCRPNHQYGRSIMDKPMYYKPRTHRGSSDDERQFEDNEDFRSFQRHFSSHSPSGSRRRLGDSFSPERKTSTPLSRHYRALSTDMAGFDDRYLIDPEQSREELLDFRDSYDRYIKNMKPFERYSPDSSEERRLHRRSILTRDGMQTRSPENRNENRSPDFFTRDGNRAHAGLCRVASDPNLSARTSTPFFWKSRCIISDHKPHRTPTSRPLTTASTTARKTLPYRNMVRRTHICGNSHAQEGNRFENTSRETDSSSTSVDYSGNEMEERGYLDLPHRVASRANEGSRTDMLMIEKRRLYEKYKNNSWLDANRSDNFPLETESSDDLGLPARKPDSLELHEKHHKKTCMRGESRDGPGKRRKCQRTSTRPDQYPDGFYPYETEHSDSDGFRKRSSSDPSPRLHHRVDCDHKKRLSFSDPICCTRVIGPHSQDESRTNSSKSEMTSDDSLTDARTNDQYVEAIERLREETRKMKDQIAKCKCPMDVKGGAGTVQPETPLVEAYNNLGRPVLMESQSRRSSRSRQDTNPSTTNSQQATKKRPGSGGTKRSQQSSRDAPTSTATRRQCANCNRACPESGSKRQPTAPRGKSFRLAPICSRPIPTKVSSREIKKRANLSPTTRRAGGSALNRTAGQREGEASSSSSLSSSRKVTYEAPSAILGEVAFQLESRIINEVFKNVSLRSVKAEKEESESDKSDENVGRTHRFYGFTVSNLPQKIRWDCRDQKTGGRDFAREARLQRRYQDVVAYLRHNFGYHVHKHSKLCQQLIQNHGTFAAPPNTETMMRLDLHDFRSVRNHVIRLVAPDECPDVLVLVDCLHALGQKEGEPILCFK